MNQSCHIWIRHAIHEYVLSYMLSSSSRFAFYVHGVYACACVRVCVCDIMHPVSCVRVRMHVHVCACACTCACVLWRISFLVYIIQLMCVYKIKSELFINESFHVWRRHVTSRLRVWKADGATNRDVWGCIIYEHRRMMHICTCTWHIYRYTR